MGSEEEQANGIQRAHFFKMKKGTTGKDCV